MIFGGVGLGICSACGAPGAFYYQPVMQGWSGVWMCDSCQWPLTVGLRVRKHVEMLRSGENRL